MKGVRISGFLSEFFWSVFSRIRTESLRIKYSDGGDTDQKNPNKDIFHTLCSCYYYYFIITYLFIIGKTLYLQ